jgi:raffinose/stachyose/melibiose transport system substrate-binding protein
LRRIADASQVVDLTGWFGQNAAVKGKILPSSFVLS